MLTLSCACTCACAHVCAAMLADMCVQLRVCWCVMPIGNSVVIVRQWRITWSNLHSIITHSVQETFQNLDMCLHVIIALV